MFLQLRAPLPSLYTKKRFVSSLVFFLTPQDSVETSRNTDVLGIPRHPKQWRETFRYQTTLLGRFCCGFFVFHVFACVFSMVCFFLCSKRIVFSLASSYCVTLGGGCIRLLFDHNACFISSFNFLVKFQVAIATHGF